MSGVKKKRNWVLIVSVSIGALLALWMVARATKVLEMYHVPTSSNLPNIRPGQIVWASNLKKIERGVYITYLTFDSLQQNEATWIHRCVGVPGDELEMKDAVLYVNAKNFDKDFNLKHDYTLLSNEPETYAVISKLTQEEFQNNGSGKSNLSLDGQQAATLKKGLEKGDSLKLDVFPPDNSYFIFFAREGHVGWSIDNFGPLRIPSDSYFVLGDNRHQSQDSRYLGFIKKEKITGVVLNK